jgi:PadR family transcriptional regulator PadR
MDIQLKKGLIEAYVLHLLKHTPTYGYSLYSDISQVLEISENALYPIFKRLEADQLIDSYSEEHNGRLRKYYRLTTNGINRLSEFKTDFLQVKKIINIIIGGHSNE